MQLSSPFGIEAVGRRSSTQARCDGSAGCQVEPAKSQCDSQFAMTVDPVPDSLQRTTFDVGFQAAASQEC